MSFICSISGKEDQTSDGYMMFKRADLPQMILNDGIKAFANLVDLMVKKLKEEIERQVV